MQNPRLFLLGARAARITIGILTIATCRAAVVAEWDFRANQNLTVAGGTGTKSCTFINGASVNTGAATMVGDRRMAEGFLHCPRLAIPTGGSTHHGLKTNGTFDQYFGTTAIGEGTITMVVRFLGNSMTGRKTLFAHKMGDSYAEMWLFYNNTSTNQLYWRAAGQSSDSRAAIIPMTMTPGDWYLVVATWKAGTANKLSVRKIGTATNTGATASVAISAITSNNCNQPLCIGVRDPAAEGSDMDIAFAQFQNVRNDDIDSIYTALMVEPDEVENMNTMGLTLRADFPGAYTATKGTVTVTTPAAGAPDTTTLAPGLFREGETVLNSGVHVGDRPKQRVLCGTKANVAPNFDKAGTLSFYWSPDFTSTVALPDLGKAYLWGTDSADDDGGFFAGRWEAGKLRAYFGTSVYSEVDMPVDANHWYLITVSWGLLDKTAVRGRVHWKEVKPGQGVDVNYPSTQANLGTPTTVKQKWGNSELCVGSRIADAVASGARGTIDQVTYQDNFYTLSGGVDGIYEDSFPKWSANPLTSATSIANKDIQEVQFPSSDVTLRGYPYNAMLRKNNSMTNLGTTTAGQGFRQLGSPTKWDYALKTAANGTTTGVAMGDPNDVLPNALKTAGSIRLLYKPDLTQTLTGRATLISAGTTSSQFKGFRVYRLDQNKLTFEIDTRNNATPQSVTVTLTGNNQFTDGKAWYYIAVAWQTHATNQGRVRAFVRKIDPGASPQAFDLNFVSNSAIMQNNGYSLSGPIQIGSRPENNTENAKGLVDEVRFVDGTAWGSSEFGLDYDRLRLAYAWFDYQRSSTERVRYIPVEKVLRTSMTMANDLLLAEPDNMEENGYQIPLEARDSLNYEPATFFARKYYTEEIVNRANANARNLVPTVGNHSVADTSNVTNAYAMLKWFGTETLFHDEAVEILNASISNFQYLNGTNAWAYGSVLISSGLPDTSDPAALQPQSRSYDRFGSGLIGAGTYLGNTSMVTLGTKVMQTYYDASYSATLKIVPQVLTVGNTHSLITLEDSDSLYITNSAYPVWKETGNATLATLLTGESDGWANHAFVDAWGHSRRKVKVDGTLDTVDNLYGDGDWNQIRGMSVGYAISHDPVLNTKTQAAVEFLRSAGRFGLYPAVMKAGSGNPADFAGTGNFANIQMESGGGSDQQNLSELAAAYIRDMLYAYDATGNGAILTYAAELAEASINAGRYYQMEGETINRYTQLSALRGVCRVKVQGDLGDQLKVVKKSSSKLLVDKPMTDFTEAVVYLPPGQYDITALRGGSGTPQTVTVTAATTVTVDAP